jgi:hypothetical protein
MRWYRRRKWLMLAALTMGTTLQVTACRDEAALFGLQTAFSSFTVPINEFIRQFIFSLFAA